MLILFAPTRARNFFTSSAIDRAYFALRTVGAAETHPFAKWTEGDLIFFKRGTEISQRHLACKGHSTDCVDVIKISFV